MNDQIKNGEKGNLKYKDQENAGCALLCNLVICLSLGSMRTPTVLT